MIHLPIIERSESRDDCNPKSFGPADQTARQNAPSALSVANADGARKLIDGYRQFDTVLQDFAGQGVRDLHATRSPKVPVTPVGHVGPAFQQDAPPAAFPNSAAFLDDVQAAFQ